MASDPARSLGSSSHPLRNPTFRRLATANLVNLLGDWIGKIALALIVYERTGSALATALLYAATEFLPAFAAPAVVARAERWSLRRALTLGYLAEGALFGALALGASDLFLVALLALAFCDGALALASRGLLRASVPLVLPADEVRRGNALLNIVFTISVAAGPALAGLLAAGVGVQTALAIDAASFAAAALLLATTAGLPAAAEDARETPWRRRLSDGVAHLRGDPTLRPLLAIAAAALVFLAAVNPIEVIYVHESLNEGAAAFGFFVAAWGIGMALGSLAFAGMRRRALDQLIFESTLLIGLAYVATAAAPTLAVACAVSVAGGFGNGIAWVAFVTRIQELTPDRFQSRTMVTVESLASAMPGIGFALGGPLAELVSPRATYLVSGLAVVGIVALGALRARRRGLAVKSAEVLQDAL